MATSLGAEMRGTLSRCALVAAITALIAVACVGRSARGGNQVSTFLNGTNNWSNPSAWSPSGVPNNGANTYDAVFNGQFHSNGTVDTLYLDENITVDQLTMTSGLIIAPNSAGPYTLTLNNALNWSGGIIANSNILASNGGNISASTTCILEAGLDNRGTFTYTASFTSTPDNQLPLRLDAGSTILNEAGATFNIAGDAGISVTSSTAQLNNQGLLVKSAGTGVSLVDGTINDTGTVQSQSGTLEFLGGNAQHSGSLTASAGATLAFVDGATTFTSTASIGGQGTLQFAGNPLIFNGQLLGGAGPLQIAGGETQFNAGSNITSLAVATASGGRALQLSGNGTTTFNTGNTVSLASLSTSPAGAGNTTLVLTGPDDIALTGPANWTGGEISGPLTSPNNNVFVNAPMTISGNGLALEHRNLQNNSTITFSGGNLQMGDGSVIQNTANSTFNVGATIGWGPTLTGFSLPSFTNAGLIIGNGTFNDVRLTNTGTVHVTGGTLTLNHGETNGNYQGWSDSGINYGTYQIDQGATMDVSDHTMAASSTVQGAGTMQFRGNNNFVAGTYNMTGQTVVYGGLTFQPGATITNIGQLLNLTFSGGVVFNTGNPVTLHDVILNGSLAGPDPVTITGKFSGAGTLSTDVIAPGNISPGNSPGILTVQGKLTMTPTTTVNIELAGNSNASATEFDSIAASNTLTLNGSLALALVNGYLPAPGDQLMIISDTTSLAGAFENVAPGARLMTSDGTGSFIVDYGAASPFGNRNVVITSYQAVPEPIGAAVLLALTGGLLRRRHRMRVA